MKRSDFDTIAVHHAAMPDSPEFELPDIRWFHVHERGYDDVGYHVVVERVGDHVASVFARPWFMAGAHAKGHNTTALGVCLIGNFSETDPDEELLREAARAIASIMHVTGIRRMRPHNKLEGAATECPGTRFPWARFVGLVEGFLGQEVDG